MSRNVAQDRNSKIRYAVVIVAVAVCAYVLFGRTGEKHRPITETETEEVSMIEDDLLDPVADDESPAPLAASKPQAQIKGASAYAPVTAAERASLETLSTILFEETRGNSNPKDLLNRLMHLGYEPVVSKDNDEYTGSMVIIRTKNTLPGTRYFHAQFFTDENGQFFPQHVSFEFRPTQSMEDVVKSLESRFGRLGKPSTNDGIWMTWKLPNDYSLWIKRMEAQDLAGDPFNAYAPEDVNTLRVAIEKDVAGHEDDEPSL